MLLLSYPLITITWTHYFRVFHSFHENVYTKCKLSATALDKQFLTRIYSYFPHISTKHRGVSNKYIYMLLWRNMKKWKILLVEVHDRFVWRVVLFSYFPFFFFFFFFFFLPRHSLDQCKMKYGKCTCQILSISICMWKIIKIYITYLKLFLVIFVGSISYNSQEKLLHRTLSRRAKSVNYVTSQNVLMSFERA